MPETTFERVMRVIADTQKLEADRVREDSTFKELGIDSLDGLQIVFALEEEFGLDVPDTAAMEFSSVREVVAGIELLLARKDSTGTKDS
jgi:acyl carrier protein